MKKMSELGLSFYSDLGRLKKYKFVDSFVHPLLSFDHNKASKEIDLKSRINFNKTTQSYKVPEQEVNPIKVYWELLLSAFEDWELTQDELNTLISVRANLGLKPQEIRMLHAKIFSATVNQFIHDEWLDDNETVHLQYLHQSLSALGWAPGE